MTAPEKLNGREVQPASRSAGWGISPKLLVPSAKSIYRKLVRFEEHYLDLTHCDFKADVVCLKHSYELLQTFKSARVRRVKTMILDTSKNEEQIYRQFNKTTKNEIRRAARERVTHFTVPHPTPDDIREFLEGFRDLALRKGVSPFPYEFYAVYRDRCELLMTGTRSSHGDVLSRHIYLTRGAVALLINSVSTRSEDEGGGRQLAARANRLNHWEDIRYLKGAGFNRVDLGGWAAREEDEAKPELKSIADFKSGFGPATAYAYYHLIPVSKVGQFIVRLRNIRA